MRNARPSPEQPAAAISVILKLKETLKPYATLMAAYLHRHTSNTNNSFKFVRGSGQIRSAEPVVANLRTTFAGNDLVPGH